MSLVSVIVTNDYTEGGGGSPSTPSGSISDGAVLSDTVYTSADPSANPNGLLLLGSATLASSGASPTFETNSTGLTYPDDYARFTVTTSDAEGGGGFKFGMGEVPQAYFETNRFGSDGEIYKTIDIAFETRITGDVPHKLFRAIVFSDPVTWAEAAIGHVWFDHPNGELNSDPARGVVGTTVQTTTYNDFENFLWEGITTGSTDITDGQWHVVRIYLRLNTPGNADGICRVWIDGNLDIEDTTINWVDSYTTYGWNAFFLESYYNSGVGTTSTVDYRNLYVRGSEIGGVAPFYTVDVDNYGNLTAFLADSQIADVSGGSNYLSYVAATGSPPDGGSNVIRATYVGGQGSEQTAGFDITIPNAATLNLREIWIRVLCRWDPNWVTNGPYSGNPDHKTFFLFDQDELGSQRWEHHNGHNGSGFGQFVTGEGDTQGDATQCWDGSYQEIWIHAKMGGDPASSGDAEWVVRYDTIDYTRTWVGGFDATFSGKYFNKLAVFRNLNRGSTSDQYIEFRYAEFYDEDPFGGII